MLVNISHLIVYVSVLYDHEPKICLCGIMAAVGLAM